LHEGARRSGEGGQQRPGVDSRIPRPPVPPSAHTALAADRCGGGGGGAPVVAAGGGAVENDEAVAVRDPRPVGLRPRHPPRPAEGEAAIPWVWSPWGARPAPRGPCDGIRSSFVRSRGDIRDIESMPLVGHGVTGIPRSHRDSAEQIWGWVFLKSVYNISNV